MQIFFLYENHINKVEGAEEIFVIIQDCELRESENTTQFSSQAQPDSQFDFGLVRTCPSRDVIYHNHIIVCAHIR